MMIDSYALALSAIAAGTCLSLTFVWGYHAGRKDQTPGDRR